MRMPRILVRLWARVAPARRLEVIQGDGLPARLPRRNLVLAREDAEDWCVGLRCPCGCGRAIELLVIAEAKPRWDLKIDQRQRPTLIPSIWLQTGCRSHFWIDAGRIKWCD